MKSEVHPELDHDVVVVGGGPAGCSAGLFVARAGLDTVIFDRGRSSLRQCAYLENYLGFPEGIDIETFYERMHDHAENAGCVIRTDLVSSVEQREQTGFQVDIQEGEPVTTRWVIAATKYDTEYLRPLDEEAMFKTETHGGEEHEQFDREYAGSEGSTPIEGLYIASPSEQAIQVVSAAGYGATVARRLLKDRRLENGWWGALVDSPDWLRRATEHEEVPPREDMIDKFDAHFAEDAPIDKESDRYQRVRNSVIENRVESHLTEAEIAERKGRGQEQLLEYIDADRIIAKAAELESARNSTDANH